MPRRKVTDEKKVFLEELKKDGVEVLAVYNEPYNGNWQIFALLPVEKCEPTPFQREVSPAHLFHLKNSIDKIGRFLDPIIVVRTKDGKYYTPNGSHRLSAMKELGKEKIAAIIIPDEKVMHQILAMNVEKAHNIKEKSLEVIKMYQHFLEMGEGKLESDYAFEFEEPFYITLGLIYQERERFSGASYLSLLRRIEQFLDKPLKEAYEERKRRAKRITDEVEPMIQNIINKLHERGIKLPFLKQIVVSQNNPYKRKKKGVFDFDEGINQFIQNLSQYDVSKVREEELLEEMPEE
ncbi:MAG: ParB/RepB/Spo0J family partition protein [candidate division WOR-3 bacterium]|nr:ParB/RepB/Spo0J family partition protein [candidate division WOR-3 bacterium]MCX7837006.1 ParB/RepB/Spo0J family partition protein [candidate division WOR-3 bacterium]MDW8114632.1 ParB/RepB/Spo0J family partition protein [candidate division WOR-3 bacterium]